MKPVNLPISPKKWVLATAKMADDKIEQLQVTLCCLLLYPGVTCSGSAFWLF